MLSLDSKSSGKLRRSTLSNNKLNTDEFRFIMKAQEDLQEGGVATVMCEERTTPVKTALENIWELFMEQDSPL